MVDDITWEGLWIHKTQEDDGHWDAALHGGREDADLRVTALLCLAAVADGSTLHSGLYGSPLRKAVWWILAQQDDQGRTALRTDPYWFRDHLIATVALAEALRVSELGPVSGVIAGSSAVRDHLRMMRGKVTAEEVVWCRLLERSLRLGVRERVGKNAETPLLQVEHEALANSLARADPVVEDTVRARAAAFLLQCLGDEEGIPEQPPDDIWPPNLMEDPLATFYATVATWRLGGQAWERANRSLLVMGSAQLRPGEQHSGSWDPVGEFGKGNGRFGSTAMAVMTLTFCYRYSWLEVAGRAEGLREIRRPF